LAACFAAGFAGEMGCGLVSGLASGVIDGALGVMFGAAVGDSFDGAVDDLGGKLPAGSVFWFGFSGAEGFTLAGAGVSWIWGLFWPETPVQKAQAAIKEIAIWVGLEGIKNT
jgi:hypothetical protein